MKVKKLMTKTVATVYSKDNLSNAIEQMRSKNCVAVPVVNESGKLLGIVSDREIGLMVSKLDKKPSEISVGETISAEVISCKVKDRLEVALKKMKENRIRRLPVVDKDEKVIGILSITDFLVSDKIDKSVKKKVYSVLKAIGKPEKSKPIVLNEISG
jgi:CBS domain-containing protein